MSAWSNIAAVFAVGREPEQDREMIVIKRLPDGTFRNYYGWYVQDGKEIWNCYAGNYKTLKKAKEMAKKHRPSAEDYTELFFPKGKKKAAKA